MKSFISALLLTSVLSTSFSAFSGKEFGIEQDFPKPVSCCKALFTSKDRLIPSSEEGQPWSTKKKVLVALGVGLGVSAIVVGSAYAGARLSGGNEDAAALPTTFQPNGTDLSFETVPVRSTQAAPLSAFSNSFRPTNGTDSSFKAVSVRSTQAAPSRAFNSSFQTTNRMDSFFERPVSRRIGIGATSVAPSRSFLKSTLKKDYMLWSTERSGIPHDELNYFTTWFRAQIPQNSGFEELKKVEFRSQMLNKATCLEKCTQELGHLLNHYNIPYNPNNELDINFALLTEYYLSEEYLKKNDSFKEWVAQRETSTAPTRQKRNVDVSLKATPTERAQAELWRVSIENKRGKVANEERNFREKDLQKQKRAEAAKSQNTSSGESLWTWINNLGVY